MTDEQIDELCNSIVWMLRSWLRSSVSSEEVFAVLKTRLRPVLVSQRDEVERLNGELATANEEHLKTGKAWAKSLAENAELWREAKRLESFVEQLADPMRWNWTNGIGSSRDAADRVLMTMAQLDLIDRCMHPSGGFVYRCHGRLFGRLDDFTEADFDAALAKERLDALSEYQVGGHS